MDSSIPSNSTMFEVPGGLYIKASSVVRMWGGLLIDDVFYPFSLWNMVGEEELDPDALAELDD
jgi:hypothetical protein